ncbi:hypothetical protein AVEN_126358-1 [Araneus ventricosus]|uniref:Uncharacterized protein n=1 Tax=Araneus ventricosus TaxID=182803 RepID=A0A4Y2FWX2_ARAVE|nr:hypothetical protein AVEN_126358-1 [Araneus ventricosus]
MSLWQSQYANPPSMPTKFIVPPKNYERVLKELSDEKALKAVDSASDIDELQFIEHADYEIDSEIERGDLEPPQASSSHHVSHPHDDSPDVEDVSVLGNDDFFVKGFERSKRNL